MIEPNKKLILRIQKLCADQRAQLVYLALSGSHATGCATSESDQDVRGVFLPSLDVILGLDKLETLEIKSEEVVLHSARKFVRLCAHGNPNILDWLFVPHDCRWFVQPEFKFQIQDHRRHFLSKQLHARFRGYARGHFQKMRRKSTRDLGAKRKADLDEHGYSTKNAMHLIRLARMGCEALETGEYNVRRPDAEELLAIRRGEWTAERVEEVGMQLIDRMDEAVERSELPEHPDMRLINSWLVTLTKRLHRW